MGLFGDNYRYEIGILFDIDGLGTSSYGEAAYRILFNSLDQSRMTMCLFHDGDTNATLAGRDRVYCIAIQATRRNVISYVREVLSTRTDPGLLPPHRRFLDGAVVANEPVVLAGGVGRTGMFAVFEDDLIQPSWVTGTGWQLTVIRRA